MSILVSGTVALDSIETSSEKRLDILGGSASYASVAAAFGGQVVDLCAVVGHDFPLAAMEMFHAKGVRTDCLQVEPNDTTFRWSGRYEDNMNHRETLSVSLDVLEKFRPKLNEAARDARIVLLANMSPQNQLEVLSQANPKAFVIADSMDLWINIAKDALIEVMGKADLFVINEDEAKQFTGTSNLVTAGHRLRAMGPKQVVVKKGEHGAMLFGEGHFFSTTAFPLDTLQDPTGAGDTFAGGIAGYLAGLGKKADELTFVDMNRAVVQGTVMASFTCEEFGIDRLATLTLAEFDQRRDMFRNYAAF